MAIEEELSLSIEDALRSIDQLAEALQNALIGFFTAFDDAIKQAGQSPIDLTFQAEVEGGQQPVFEENQEIAIQADSADAAGAASDIQEEIGQVEGAVNYDVEGDASGLKGSIEEATTIDESPELVVGVSVDTDEAQAEAASAKEEIEKPIEVSLEIENADQIDQVENSISNAADAADGLSSSIDGASSAANDLSDSATKAGDSTKKAKEETEELELTWQKVAVIAAQAFAATVAASAGFVAGFATAAVESQAATLGFRQQLGDLGRELQNSELEGLNLTIQDLAVNLGSSDEAALRAVQTIALLGQSAGQTNEAIETTVSDVTKVAASLRATNPGLGELDEIISRLTTGLARGNAGLARLGISITSQEIRARAAAMTQKSVNDQFDRFELLAAGAAIASEKLGRSFTLNIEEALKNPKIALESIAETFGDTLELFGRPFVSPLIELSSQLLPDVLSAIDVFADLVETFIPLLRELADAAQPIIAIFVEFARSLVDDFGSALEEVGRAVGNLLTSLEPLFNVMAELSEITLAGLAKIIEGIAAAFNFLGEDLSGLIVVAVIFARNIVAIKNAVLLLNGALIANPLLAFASAAAIVIGVISELNRAPDPFDGFVDSIAQGLLVLKDVPPAIEEFTASLEEYIRLEQILEDRTLVKALADTGISAEQFSQLIAGGTESLREFVRLLLATDQQLITLGDTGLPVTTENLDSLTDSQLRSITTNQSLIDVLFDNDNAVQTLINGYNNLSASTNASAEAIFNQAAQAAGLTPQLVEVIKNNNALSDGTIDYSAALDELRTRVERNIAIQEQQAIVSGEAAQKNREFAEGISEIAVGVAAGTITIDNFANAIGLAGLDIAQVEEVVKNLSEEMATFVDNAVERVPTVANAFKDLGPDNTAQSLIDSFNTQIAATNQWNAEMTRLRREGQNDILRVVAELGPEQGLLLLQQYQGQENILAEHLRNMAAAEQAALQATREVAVLNWLETRDITGAAAEAVVRELESKLTLADATEASIIEAVENVRSNSPELENAFGDVGANAADALTVGSVEELQAKAGELNVAVEAVWTGAGGVAETASRIAAEAGVNKFNEIVSTGFLNAETASSIIVRTSTFFSTTGLGVGTAFGEGIRLGTLMQEASILNASLGMLTRVGTASFALAQRMGRMIGEQLISGIVEAIREGRDSFLVSDRLSSLLVQTGQTNAFVASLVGANVGNSMISGLVNAIRSGDSAVSGVARQIIANAEAAAKREAESDSPSKVWERLGRDLVSGLTKGLNDSSFLASGAAANVIGQATPAFSQDNSTSISISVPVTVSGGTSPTIGAEIGRAAGAELQRILRTEARLL